MFLQNYMLNWIWHVLRNSKKHPKEIFYLLYSFIMDLCSLDSCSSTSPGSNMYNTLWHKCLTLQTEIWDTCYEDLAIAFNNKSISHPYVGFFNSIKLAFLCNLLKAMILGDLISTITFPMSPTTQTSCSFLPPSANIQRSSIARDPLSYSTITYALSRISGI